jgi:hypothetical protein
MNYLVHFFILKAWYDVKQKLARYALPKAVNERRMKAKLPSFWLLNLLAKVYCCVFASASKYKRSLNQACQSGNLFNTIQCSSCCRGIAKGIALASHCPDQFIRYLIVA